MKRSALPRSTTPIPRKRKTPRRSSRVRDPKYLGWIRQLPCVVCFRNWIFTPLAGPIFGAVDLGGKAVSEAAHIGSRGLGQKCTDYETCPLCDWHHRTGLGSHHVLGKWFWQHHGLDRDKIIAELNQVYEENQ